MLVSKGEQRFEVSESSQKDVYYVKYENVTRTCLQDPMRQTTHDSNNAKVSVDTETGKMWFKCYSEHCTGRRYLGTLLDQEEEEEKMLDVAIDKEEQEKDQYEIEFDTARNLQSEFKEYEVRPDGTEVYYIRERYLSKDSRFDPSHPVGQEFLKQCRGKVILNTIAQGTGKTYWVNRVIAYLLSQGMNAKAVSVLPLISLTLQTVAQLRKVLQSMDLNKVVLHYKDALRLEDMSEDDYEILVSSVMSISKLVCPETIEVLNVDEVLTVLNQLLMVWDQDGIWKPGAKSQSQKQMAQSSKNLMRFLGEHITTAIFTCAQATESQMLLMLELFGLLDRKRIKVNMVGNLIPQTTMNSVTYGPQLISIIKDQLMGGEIVAVSANVKSFGRRFQRELKRVAEEVTRPDGSPINMVSWDSEWLAKQQNIGKNPSADVGAWMKASNIHLLIYTPAMSPGMSINGNIVTRRCMWLARGGADAATMAQMANRVRNVPIRDIDCFSERSDNNVGLSNPELDRERAMERMVNQYPEEVEEYLTKGMKLCKRLKESNVNEFRLANLMTKQGIMSCPTKADVAALMDNTVIGSIDDNQGDTNYPPGWHDLLDNAPALNTKYFLAYDELQDFKQERDAVVTFHQTEIYTKIGQTLPHFVIKNKEYCLLRGLSPGAFDAIIKGGIHKLYSLVKLLRHCRMTSQEVRDRKVSWDTMAKNLAPGAFLVRCYHEIVVLLGLDRMNTYPVTGEVIAGAPSTDLDRIQTYKWLKRNWDTILKHLGKGLKKKYATIPASSADAVWVQVLRAVLVHFGLGLHEKDDGLLKVVLASFWKQMKADTVVFGSFLTTSQSKHYGPTPVSLSPCEQCGGREHVECRMQGGLSCCVKHRDRTVQLDYDKMEADEESKSIEESDDEKGQCMDMCLGFIGFKEGRRSTDILTHEQMEAVICLVTFTQIEVDQVDRLFDKDLTEWSDAKTARRQLKAVMTKEHTHVTLVPGRVGSGVDRKTTWMLQKSD
jgi:hypothetical protein